MNKKRILVVDDNAGVTRYLKLSLEQIGTYEVVEAQTGRGGLEMARKLQPDVALLDIMMPDMDGGEVARRIRAEPSLKKTKIVFLTALVSGRDAGGQGLRSGGHPCLSKPVNLKELTACLEEVCRADATIGSWKRG